MTIIQKLKKIKPELDVDSVVRQSCPSDYGFDDPERCIGMGCIACWIREVPSHQNQIPTVLDAGATLPTRGHETDAGLDLYSREEAVIEPGKSAIFDTGVHMEIPRGYAGVLIAKSGLNVKADCTSTGLIDADYTGSIVVKLYNQGDKEVHIAAKQKISQLVLVPIITPKPVQVDSLGKTERGDNGFGSTGAF